MIKKNKLRILAIGPHPDDVELGCFGTLAKFAAQKAEIHILILAGGEKSGKKDNRTEEAKKSAALIGAKLYFGNLPDTRISEGFETISLIEDYLKKINPNMVFGPSVKDTHQDHRNTAKAIISATRIIPEEVYVYQTPSTTKDFVPVIHFDVTDHFHKKIDAVKIHISQGQKSYMAGEAVEGLARYLAYDIGLNGRLVEGFEVIRILKK
jgi:LmbE family N-acetylglucosaminyl deacetylase